MGECKTISTEQEDVMDSPKRIDGAPFSRRQFVIASATFGFGLGLAAIALPDLARADEESLG